MTSSLQQLLHDTQHRLTAADRKLADALLASPRQAAFLSTHEIAQRAAVHPTSAVRLARKLGFAGYPELRATLQNELFDESAAAARVRKRIERLGRDRPLQAFVESEIRALERLPQQVKDADIVRVARAIIRARTVFLHATGHSETLARLLEIRLTRGGYGARIVRGDAREMAATLLQMRRNDVLVAFAFFSTAARTRTLVEQAHAAGGRTVLVTDIMNPASRPRTDVTLAAMRGDPGEARSLTVPMAVCNTLMLQVSRLDGGRMIRALEQLEHARAALEAAR
jgi:DNA-binding MurR/RpiR family transcriptional regulator